MQLEELIETLHQNKNPEKIEGMENYMRNKFNFLGLQSVERRKLAQIFLKTKRAETKERFSKEDPDASIIDWETLFLLWELPEREFQLIGLDYLKQVDQYLVLDDLPELRKLVTTKSWWDTVDALAKNFGTLVLKEPQVVHTMREWSLEENFWIRRISILHQLAFKERTNTKLLSEVILNNIDEDEFFIRKAIGWALREYAKTDAEWVREFTDKFEKQLSSLSYREATKHLT